MKEINDSENKPYFSEKTVHSDIMKSIGSLDFVWDEAKNQHNIQIHHIRFETAALVFNDDKRIEIFDEEHSEDEDRYDTIGKPVKRLGSKFTLGMVNDLLYVVYTDKIILGRERIRIISARKATKLEEALYYSE